MVYNRKSPKTKDNRGCTNFRKPPYCRISLGNLSGLLTLGSQVSALPNCENWLYPPFLVIFMETMMSLSLYIPIKFAIDIYIYIYYIYITYIYIYRLYIYIYYIYIYFPWFSPDIHIFQGTWRAPRASMVLGPFPSPTSPGRGSGVSLTARWGPQSPPVMTTGWFTLW